MANHVRWCDKNPKDYANGIKRAIDAMSIARKESGFLNNFEKAKALGKKVPVSKLRGKSHVGIQHTDETKEILSKKALASKHRRLRKNPIEYNGVLLDSTWELELAKRLDSLKIEWIRPEPLPWIDNNGKHHNYFPDFYLPKYKIYLDPKNPHAINVQMKKLKKLENLYPNIVLLRTLEECKNFKI